MESAGVLYEIRTFTGAGDFLRANEHFDIIFMDIIMPELDGMRAARQYSPSKSFEHHIPKGKKIIHIYL